MLHIVRLLFALPLSLVLAGAAAAPGDAPAAAGDPPARAGRLSLIEGSVVLRQADAPDWDEASENWPITSGDRIHTPPGSRAEIRVGSSVVHLDGSSEIEIRHLADGPLRIWLNYGSLALRVRNPDPDAGMVIETRDGRARIETPGHYRVSSTPGMTALSTYRGQLEFESDDSRAMVPEGQGVDFRFAGRTDYVWRSAERDDFFAWSLARDLRDDELGVPSYVSPEMTGVEELALHGDWHETVDYGPVWYPRALPSDWAPYRWGRWIWVEPWGWTWLDDAPWGFAPFHYGRWVYLGGSWAWVPGVYTARPVYAPALVVWIGSPGWQVGFSSGHRPALGWFPLAPHEVFVPTFRASPTFVQRLNITHVTHLTRIIEVTKAPHRAHHAHRHYREAVTVVPVDDVRHGRRVDPRALRDPRWTAQDVPLATAMPRRQRDSDLQVRTRAARIEEQRRQHLDDGGRVRHEAIPERRRQAVPVLPSEEEAVRRLEPARRVGPAEHRAPGPERRARDEPRRTLPAAPRAMPDDIDRRIRETAPPRGSGRAVEPRQAAPATAPMLQRRERGERGRTDEGPRRREERVRTPDERPRERAGRFSPGSGSDAVVAPRLRAAPGDRPEPPVRASRPATEREALRAPRERDPARARRDAGRATRDAIREPSPAAREGRQRAVPEARSAPSRQRGDEAGAGFGRAGRTMRALPEAKVPAVAPRMRDGARQELRHNRDGAGRGGFGRGEGGRGEGGRGERGRGDGVRGERGR